MIYIKKDYSWSFQDLVIITKISFLDPKDTFPTDNKKQIRENYVYIFKTLIVGGFGVFLGVMGVYYVDWSIG